MPAPSSTRLSARLGSSIGFWAGAAVGLSVAVCLAITWLHHDEQETVLRSRRLLTDLREGRIDLAKGFLHLSLSGDPRSPFRREQGLALLDQAVAAVMDAAGQITPAAETGPEDAGLVGEFQAKILAFRKQLDAYRRSQPAARDEMDLAIQLSYHALDRLAQRTDLAFQRDLNVLATRLDARYSIVLIVSVALLTATCIGVYQVQRRQDLDRRALRAHQERLEESESRHRALFEEASDGILLMAADGGGLQVNRAFARMHGYESPKEMESLRLDDLVAPGAVSLAPERLRRAAAGELSNFEVEHRRKDGSAVLLDVTVTRVELGGRTHLLSFHRDITERRRLEEERETTVELLDLLNSCASRRDLMRAVTAFLSERFDCEAVGIRLREGEDFPYFETRGFSAEFVELENHLCLMDVNGMPVRDPEGNPALECMCGNVLCGRFNPAKSFFSARGSFWANDTTRLLATTTPAERRANTRNRCNSEGYESVALVALRVREETFGLIQLNDRRKGRFTAERIALLERLADSLAIGLADRLNLDRLRDNEIRLRALGDNIPGGALYQLLLSPDGRARYTYMSAGIERIFGVPAARVMAEPVVFWDLIVEEDRAGIAEAQARSARDLTPFDHEFRQRTIGGDVRWLHARSTPRRLGDGSVLWDGVVTDVTGRRRSEEEVRLLNAELEERVRIRTAQLEDANRELESFSYSVSHDLRSPLRGIDGWSLALLEDYGAALDDRAKEFLGRVRSETQRMGRLIDDLLDLSRVGRAEMRAARVDLGALALEIVGGLRNAERGRDVTVTIAPDLVAWGDPRLLRLALENLLGNAWKYTGRTQAATIEVASQAGPGPGIGAGQRVFVVRDNGAGFDMAHARKLFTPFQRLHTESEFPGTGVGLAIVQRIVHRHGGRIWAEAAPDRGAAFHFTLPKGERA